MPNPFRSFKHPSESAKVFTVWMFDEARRMESWIKSDEQISEWFMCHGTLILKAGLAQTSLPTWYSESDIQDILHETCSLYFADRLRRMDAQKIKDIAFASWWREQDPDTQLSHAIRLNHIIHQFWDQ